MNGGQATQMLESVDFAALSFMNIKATVYGSYFGKSAERDMGHGLKVGDFKRYDNPDDNLIGIKAIEDEDDAEHGVAQLKISYMRKTSQLASGLLRRWPLFTVLVIRERQLP